jgi:3'-5' exoribonuclease
MTNRLPFIESLESDASGWGFFLCTQKDVRQTRAGDLFMALSLQDKTGQIKARIFNDVGRLREEFEAGDFVKVQGHADRFTGQVQLIVERIRRVNPDQDRPQGFHEEDCIRSAPRPVDEMWAELQELVVGVRDPFVRQLLERVVRDNEPRLRLWPAAQIVHHAYRGGFLEHVLAVARVALPVAEVYGANRDVVTAGAILHDIGKLQELDYDLSASYSREGNLVGHIALGLVMVRSATAAIEGFPELLRTQIEHLVVSHHGQKQFGSPVEPMTVEALILSAADDLDAKINQVRQALQDAETDGEFTAYHARLGRVLWKGQEPG